MVTAMPRTLAVSLTPLDDRKLLCPTSTCRCRYLGSVRVYQSIPPGMVWTRAFCRGCSHWHWFDIATGVSADSPNPMDLTDS